MAHQQHVERGLTFEQVKPLVEGERYANLVPPLPTTSLTYEQMEELIELRDTVAYALLAHSTLTPEVQELCDGVLEGSEAYRKILADSRRQRWGKPWESKRRPRSSKAFLDQFKVNVASSDRPLGELMMAPTYSQTAKHYVGSVFTRGLRSAATVAHLSKSLVVAFRDWERWGVDAKLGGYYRARAVQEAVKYERWILNRLQQQTEEHFEFGDFPAHTPLPHSLAHSVYVPRARSAQDRRATVDAVAWRWGA